jgi:hypothetical protein
MYLAFVNFNTAGIVGIRPQALPPSWLALDVWEGTLEPSESVDVVLTFSAGAREVGTYTAALQVIEAETGAVVEVPLTLEGTEGTATEEGPETEPEAVLAVYPNPARDRFTVETEASAEAVSVYDVVGRVVLRVPVVNGRAEVSVVGLPAGVYVVRAGDAAALLTVRR